MTDHRNARLNEQFKREIAYVLSRKVRDPRVGRVVVTEARVTSDLSLARVYFRAEVEGEDARVKDTLEGLEAATSFIRRELGRILTIRRIPELRFVHDTTLDSARRIEAVLREVLPEGEGADADQSEGGESGEKEVEGG